MTGLNQGLACLIFLPLSHFPGFIRHYYNGLPRKNVTAYGRRETLKLLEAEKLLLISCCLSNGEQPPY